MKTEPKWPYLVVQNRNKTKIGLEHVGVTQHHIQHYFVKSALAGKHKQEFRASTRNQSHRSFSGLSLWITMKSK
jgi:hypothetical protein